jgi:hypothetical protein
MAVGPSFTKVAGGTIQPSRFVYLDTSSTDPDGVLQATGGTIPLYGISQPGTRNAPYSPLDDGNAALIGETIMIYGPPNKDVILELGGTVTTGDYLTADSNGKGVTQAVSSANTNWIGAVAMEAGVSGDLIRVQLFPSYLS